MILGLYLGKGKRFFLLRYVQCYGAYKIFHLTVAGAPALGKISRRKGGRLTTHVHLEPRLRMCGDYLHIFLYGMRRDNFTFTWRNYKQTEILVWNSRRLLE